MYLLLRSKVFFFKFYYIKVFGEKKKLQEKNNYGKWKFQISLNFLSKKKEPKKYILKQKKKLKLQTHKH
jgi:hypothetical protein